MPARARKDVAHKPTICRSDQVLDEKDEKLLLALERNARASVVDLARKIDLSRSATQERLGRLERAGVIAGYTIVRGDRSNASRIEALLLLRHSEGSNCLKIVPEIRKVPEVSAIHALAGEYDLSIWVSASDMADLDRVAGTVRSLPGVASVMTNVALAKHLESPLRTASR